MAAPSAQLIAAKVLLRFTQRSMKYEFLAAEAPSAPTPPNPGAYPCELVRSAAFPGIFLPEAPCNGRYRMGWAAGMVTDSWLPIRRSGSFCYRDHLPMRDACGHRG